MHASDRIRVADVLLVLALSAAYTFLFADRLAISILVEPIKQAFELTDGQIGLLQSAPILICYVLIGPLVSTFSDRVSRRWAMLIGLCVWAVLSSVSAVAMSFAMLFALRLGAGIGEVALVPSASATLAGRFNGPVRNIAIGCFFSAPYVGIALAMYLGGWFLSLPDRGFIAPLPQWRLLFPILCIPGLLFALMLFFFRETRQTKESREAQRVEGPVQSVGLIALLKERPGFYAAMFIATAMGSAIGYAATSWMPAYLMRTFGMSPNEAGELLSVTVIMGGVVGAAGGSVLAAIGQRFRHDAPLWLALISFAGMLLLAHSIFDGHRPSMLLLCALMALPTLPYAGLIAYLQGQTPDAARARIGTSYSFCEAVLGLTAGSLAVGLVTDYVLKSEALVGHSIYIVIVTASLAALASLLFLILSRRQVVAKVGTQQSGLASGPNL